MYSRDQIATAARAKGHTEEEIQRILAQIGRLKTAGLVKTSGGGANVGITRKGSKALADLRAQGKISPR